MVLSRKVAYHILCCIPLCICLAIIVGGYITWWAEIDKMTYTEKKNCTETTCFVQVVNNDCFAKIADLIDPTLYSVRCDKDRKGNYNITLPCNIKKNTNKPILHCVNNTSKGDQMFASIFSFIFGGYILLMFLFLIYGIINIESRRIINNCELPCMTNYFDSVGTNNSNVHNQFPKPTKTSNTNNTNEINNYQRNLTTKVENGPEQDRSAFSFKSDKH